MLEMKISIFISRNGHFQHPEEREMHLFREMELTISRNGTNNVKIVLEMDVCIIREIYVRILRT